MKNLIRKFFLCLLLLPALSIASGATMPPVDVVVTHADGKAAYKGTTDASGAFATGNLEPGNYIVQFNSKNGSVKGSKFALAVTAGKNVVSADSVAGEKLADAGVAMKVAVASATRINGRVGKAGTLATKTPPNTVRANAGSPSGPSKMINGKKYYWVHPNKSSLEGGQWVEEGSPEADQAASVKAPSSQSRVAPPSGMRGY